MCGPSFPGGLETAEGKVEGDVHTENGYGVFISHYLLKAIAIEMGNINPDPELSEEKDLKSRFDQAKKIIDQAVDKLLAEHKIKFMCRVEFGCFLSRLLVPTSQADEENPAIARDKAVQAIRDFHTALSAQFKGEYEIDVPLFIFDPDYLHAGGEPIWPKVK